MALWCALQLASGDLPPKCIDFAKQTAERRLGPKTGTSRSPIAWEPRVDFSSLVQHEDTPQPGDDDLMNGLVNDYDDEVFTDTDDELDAAEKKPADG